MYKILYLPLGEELLIYKEFKYSVIRTLSPAKSNISLRTPGIDEEHGLGLYNINQFKVAYFGSISIASWWIEELIARDSSNRYKMRREYFEIVKV